MAQSAKLIFCNCAYSDVISPEVKRDVFDRLCESGVEFTAVPDLCDLAAKADPSLVALAGADDLRIAACFPRAVRWLFYAAGAGLADGAWRVANMRTQSPAEVASAMLDGLEAGRPRAQPAYEALSAAQGQWVPWFPVIDYSRCENCTRCIEFCLFGVYDFDDGGAVVVRDPDKCKTNCPACARLCSNGAIMFPKYDQRPINGDQVKPEDLQGSNMNVDLAKLASGDVYAKLRSRDRPAGTHQISEISRQLGIPQDVLSSFSTAAATPEGTACDRTCDRSDQQCDPACDCD